MKYGEFGRISRLSQKTSICRNKSKSKRLKPERLMPNSKEINCSRHTEKSMQKRLTRP
jgi:hypothetical protein